LVESAYVVLGEIAALGDHFGQFCLSVWLSALRAGRNAKKDLIDLVTRAIAKLVEAKGWVADQIDAAVKEMHLALVMFGVTFGESAYVVLGEIAALGDHFGQFCLSVWLSALRAGRNAKKDLIDLVTRAIAKLVEAKGWVADQIDAAVKEMHLALVMFGVTFGE